jgi:hypothetical protein
MVSLIDDEKKLGDCQFDLWKQSYVAHVPLCTASSGAAAAWTRSRAAATRCPSSNMGTSWSSPMPTTLGLFWARNRRRRHHAVKLIIHLKPNLPRKSLLTGH